MTVKSAAARAAGLFVEAFNCMFEDNRVLTVGAHEPDGLSGAASGHLVHWRSDFAAADLARLLDHITYLIDRPHPAGVITAWDPDVRWVFAWDLASDGTPLHGDDAFRWVPDESSPERDLLGRLPAITGLGDYACMPLTQPARDLLVARGAAIPACDHDHD